MSIKDEVIAWLEGSYSQEERKGALEDLMKHGCASGQVGELIFYAETEKFYQKHKEEINGILKCSETKVCDLKGYDEDDQLCLEINNLNLIAWFGFEAMAEQLYMELYE